MYFRIHHIFTFILVGFFLLIAPVVCAQPNINELTGGVATKAGYSAADSSVTALSTRVGQIIRMVMTLVGTIFLALTVFAGFLWMTAAGNDDKVTKATNILKMAVIGLIVIIAAYSLTYFAFALFGMASESSAPTVGGAVASGQCSGFWSCFGQGFMGQANNPENW